MQLRKRRLQARKRRLRVRHQRGPSRTLDLMQRAHGLRDRRRKVEQLLWHVRVALKRVQPTRKGLSCGAGDRNDVGHSCVLLARIES